MKHILTSCNYTKKILAQLETILERKLSANNILYNIGNMKTDWTILSIYKKAIINFKIALDMENRKVADENIANTIIKKIERRIKRIPTDKQTDKILDNITRHQTKPP